MTEEAWVARGAGSAATAAGMGVAAGMAEGRGGGSAAAAGREAAETAREAEAAEAKGMVVAVTLQQTQAIPHSGGPSPRRGLQW